MNTINDLLEMGFIHPKNDREVLLPTMIREVAVEELKPSVNNCSVLLKLARTVKELNSDQCLDYGLIQQVMGSVCVVKGVIMMCNHLDFW